MPQIDLIADLLNQRFLKIRELSLKICEPLEVEDYVAQPVTDVSPPKWHLAHTTWFFENFILVPHFKGYKLYNDHFPYLFNSYYVTAGDRWTRAQRGDLTRPTVADIISYRKYVDQAILSFLDKQHVSDDLLYIFEIGFQHEQQHQELLLYDIKYILGHNPTFPSYLDFELSLNESLAPSWLGVESDNYPIGHTSEDFCFDNELGAHQVFLESFEIRDTLVTNQEYLEFMNSDGYKKSTLWLSEGFDWITENRISCPMYWNFIEGEWFQYGLSGIRKMDMNEPVSHVSFYEADAFARWKGSRLPTEFEWEVASRKYGAEISNTSNFVDDWSLAPRALRSQFFGNLWEWTESAYRPYPRYKAADGTLGEYNGKFMINTMVLRGGSYGTSRDHIRYSYRNFFHPHLQWMFSGIRLANYK